MKKFDSIEEMFEYIGQCEIEANDHTTTAQAMIMPGQYFVRMHPESPIYGQCLTDEEATEGVADEEELAFELASLENSRRRGYMFTRCYSQLCPDGELGDTHVSTMTPITKELFEIARKHEWK